MVVWNEFHRLTKLELEYEGVHSGITPQIYANSRNQVDIVISVQIDGIGDLKKDDLKDLLYFCDYTTGEKLESIWKISDKKNDYSKPLSLSARVRRDIPSNALIPGIVHVHRYLSCSDSNIDKNFAVGITIPGVGNFDTSKHGTSTPNGPNGRPGSAFKSPRFLSLSTLHPINYSNIENILIRENRKFADLHCIVDDMLIVRNNTPNFNGKSSYSWIKIRTATGYHFKNKIIVRNGVRIPDVHIRAVDNTADIVCGARRRDDYDFSLIFIDAPVCGIAPDSKFVMTNKTLTDEFIHYYIGKEDNRHELCPDNSSIPKVDSEYISLVICNHTIPNIGWSAYNSEKVWQNAPSDGVIRIEVFDEYGNSGNIRIKLDFNDAKYPKITINDQLDFFN